MPFDPRIIAAEEPPLTANGDLNLPPNLAALAEQLADDSAHLASSYPPTVSTGAVHAQTRRRTSVFMAIAASLAVLLAGFLVISQSPLSDLQRYSPAPSKPTQVVTTAVPSETIVSVTELSSPEVEAMLDLMERSPDDTIRVSF